MKISLLDAKRLPVVQEDSSRFDHITKYTTVVKYQGGYFEFSYSVSDFTGHLEREVELHEVEPVKITIVKYVKVNLAAHRQN